MPQSEAGPVSFGSEDPTSTIRATVRRKAITVGEHTHAPTARQGKVRAVAQAARSRVTRRHAGIVADVVAVALIALAVHVFFAGGFPANDSWHTLIWGDELAGGRLPDYVVPFAPTPHPLLILYAAALSPLGSAVEPALQLTAMVALGVIAVGLFRLGTRLYAWPVGLLAAVLVLTRDRFLYLTSRGGVDVMALALIVAAAVLEARRSRRGWPVLALLLCAGLLRPEAWLFAAAYWLWLVPARDWRALVGLGALAAAAPVLWGLSDYVVTGDPLWSLHGTQTLAGFLERQTGVAAVPDRAWSSLDVILTQPLVIIGVCGLVAGLVLRTRSTLLPAAILGLQGAAFVGLAIFQLPLNERYLLPAALVLILGAAVAGLGWVGFRAGGKVRAIWIPTGIVAVVIMAALLPGYLPTVDSVRDKVVARQAVGADLEALLRSDPVRRAVARCGPLVSPSNFRRPQIAYATNQAEESVRDVAVGLPRERGVYVRAVTKAELPAAEKGKGRAPVNFRDFLRDIGPPEIRVPPGYSRLGRGRFWIAYSRCGGSAGQAKTNS